MKMLNHTWVKYAQLNQMKNELLSKKAQMTAALEFVKAITQGNLDTGLKITAGDGVESELSGSLVNMRDQMKKISAEEKQRHWVTEGLAKFGDILRQKNDSLTALSDIIIRSLVKYMGANQGALYLINEEKPADVFIELTACYAYERKKHINHRIEMGEGLIGQAALEKSTLYMTCVPQNYIKITSGLGEALPRNLLIVPLKLEEKIFGLVEIASFELIQPHQVEFVERLGENIASTISSVKTNEKTKRLLEETQAQAEQMRAQEEEVRQNMEELAATQEELHRILKEVQAQERYMNELIDSASDSILVIDTSYKIMSANKTLRQTYTALNIDVVKGLDASKLFEGTDWLKYKSFYDRTFAGETFQRTELFQSHGFELYFLSQHTPIRDHNGNVVASAVFAKDVTELVKAQKTAEELAANQQQQNEELKAQEEELRQNMEELSATQDEMQRIILEVQSKEKYLNDIINISNDIIFTVDTEYKVISFNKAMEKGMTSIGIKLDKGFCLLDIFQGNDRMVQKDYYDRAFKGECFDRTEHFTQAEMDMYSIVSYAPLKNEKQEIYAVAVFSKDVSEMHRTLREVKQKELELNEILNASTDSIWTVDRQYKLITFNKFFIDVFAARQVTVARGMDMIEVLQEQERASQIELYGRVFAGETFELTQTFIYQGSETHILISYTPIRDEHNEVIGAALYAKNITTMLNAQKQAENLIKAARAQNEEYKVQEEKFLQSLKELELIKWNTEQLKMREQVYAQTVLFAEVDTTWKLVYVNAKLTEVSGFQREELIGKPYSILNNVPEKLIEMRNKNIALGKSWNGVIKQRTSKNSYYWADITIVPVLDDKGGIVKILITGYPINHHSLGEELYNMQTGKLGLHASDATNEVGEGNASVRKKMVHRKFQINNKAA
jgi:PAS domain S-box-containing protein